MNRIVSVLALSLLIGGIAACSNEASTKNVEILAAPAITAYLGVEYSYNFGSSGGDNLHNYSLSNHPGWLSLEAINNNARFGVIARGVPGLTGARRGAEDVAENKDVTLSVTDGGRYGSFLWNLTVLENTIEVYGPSSVIEGKATDVDEQSSATTDECELPDMSKREITVDGVDYILHPVISEVRLLRPSVEVSKVTYEFKTSYEENRTEQDTQNKLRARKNHDFIVDYDSVDPENSKFYEALRNDDDAYRPGVVTFEPGVTRCFIRTYVNDDLIAEATELFTVNLVEVIQGVATIGGQKFDGIELNDNEPIASFKDTVPVVDNEGSTRTFTALLDKAPGYLRKSALPSEEPVALTFNGVIELNTEGSTENANAADYLIYTWTQSPEEGGNDTVDELTGCLKWGNEPIPDASQKVSLAFTGDQVERTFRVCLLNNNDEDAGADDQLAFSFSDDFGTVSARPGTSSLTIYINEWLSDVVVNKAEEVIVDSVVDADGNLIVLGSSQAAGGAPFIRQYDRFGRNLKSDIPLLSGKQGNSRPIALTYSQITNPDEDAQKDKDKTNDKIYQFGVLLETDLGLSDGLSGKDAYISVFSRVSNVSDYSLLWEYQIGSPMDDEPASMVSVGINYYIVGTTFGDWSRELVEGITDYWQDQVHSGGGDIFFSKVSLVEAVPLNNWTNVIGTADVERGYKIASNSARVSVLGDTASIVGEDSFGDVDGLLIQADAGKSSVDTMKQFGSSLYDEVTALSFNNNNLWVSVSSLEEAFDDKEKQQSAIDSKDSVATFETKDIQHLRFNANVEIKSKNLLLGASDGDDYVTAGASGERVNYFGGKTSGSFKTDDESIPALGGENAGGSDAFLAKTSFDSRDFTDEALVWTLQFGTEFEDEVVDVELENVTKLSVITKEGTIYKISKISTEGKILTK